MIEHIPKLGEVARPPTFIGRSFGEGRLVREVIVIDTVLAFHCLQPSPRPHIPTKAKITFKSQARRDRLLIRGMRISLEELRRKRTPSLCNVGAKG